MNIKYTRFVWIMLCLGGLSLCVGCGADRPPMGEVTGTVTWKGKPLEKGFINFVVDGQRDASGTIVDGKIVSVSTYDEGDGVPIGEAKVAIMSVKEAPSSSKSKKNATNDPNVPQASTVTLTAEYITPIRYANPDISGLTATIHKGMNELTFDLTQ